MLNRPVATIINYVAIAGSGVLVIGAIKNFYDKDKTKYTVAMSAVSIIVAIAALRYSINDINENKF